jgi:hypothetical protein
MPAPVVGIHALFNPKDTDVGNKAGHDKSGKIYQSP